MTTRLMNRNLSLPTIRSGIMAAAMLVVSAGVFASTAQAGHNEPVVDAAKIYRRAITDFERVVFRNDHMDRTERHIADALEDQSSRVLSRARDWRRLDRLQAEFARARVIERQVESIVFANPGCPSRVLLSPAWQGVLAASDHLAAEIDRLSYAVARPPISVGPICPNPHPGVSVNRHYVPSRYPAYQAVPQRSQRGYSRNSVAEYAIGAMLSRFLQP